MKDCPWKVIEISSAILACISASSALISSVIDIIWFAFWTIYSINPTDTSKECHSYLIIRNFHIRINNIFHIKLFIIEIYIIFERVISHWNSILRKKFEWTWFSKEWRFNYIKHFREFIELLLQEAWKILTYK